MQKIKLVIWDLDETFWKGTLSEEGIIPIESNIKLVKELTDRGIINSIVSKNEFYSVKEKLLELGIWEYFVFPSIEWKPKGVAINNIIEKCQLRDENVLFLDDNHLNLKEAKFYNPNLYVEFPNFIPNITNHIAFLGKNDREHTRLKQYKILEEKAIVRNEFNDNIKFLESSNIKVEFIKADLVNIARIVELIERTNQLNYTKIRSILDDVELLLQDKSYESIIVRVKDNFGDYGIVGFYSIHKEMHELLHFVFSCRILNLGVAQYVYSFLKFPKLKLVPEIAEELDQSTPHWIKELSIDDTINNAPVSKHKRGVKTKMFFKGGCDLGQMLFYLKGNNFDIKEETNYVSKGNFSIHQEHTQILLDSNSLTAKDKDYVQNCSYLPFTDDSYYSTNIFNDSYDCLIYSVLMDYTNEIYVHKNKNILLPFGGYYNLWTENNNFDNLVNHYKRSNIKIEKEQLQQFEREFKHVGQISTSAFIENLKLLRELIPLDIPIIFINGAELESPLILEREALSRHKNMNGALDKFLKTSKNTFLLDVRKVVNKPSQLTNNLRHYKREVYRDLSSELLILLNNILDKKIKTKINPIIVFLELIWLKPIHYIKPFLIRTKNKMATILK